MKSELGTIERDNYHLQYRIEGKGPTALVIGSALFYSRVFSENLRHHLRLVFLDHRCFTAKESDDSIISLDVILDDIEAARKKLNLERVIIIGHSGHGYMALEYAKKYPEHVSHVVLIGHGPDLSLKAQEEADKYWNNSASKERKAAFEKNMEFSEDQLKNLTPAQQFIKRYVLHGARIWYDYHYDSSPLWEEVEINIPLFNQVWGKIFQDIEITKGLDSFKKPVFLAMGKYDFLVGESAWDSVMNKFHNIQVEIFPKSGHTPPYEESDLFDQKLIKWLDLNNSEA